jgi:hypothetical protein
MGATLGKISGPILADNLRRNGVNLAFDTKVLYLDVVNNRVGFNTNAPATDLYTPNDIDSIDLIADVTSDLADFVVYNNNIQNLITSITIQPNQTSNPTITTPGLSTDNFYIYSNVISNTVLNSDINLTAIGTGVIKLNNNTLVTGDLHATGNITWDGNITLGNSPTDTVTFDAEISSNVVPSNTTYNLGAPTTNVWAFAYAGTSYFNSVSTGSLIISSSLTSTGTTEFKNNTTIGASSADTLTVNAGLTHNLIPATTNNIDFGSSSKFWNNLYASTLTDGVIQFNSNSITTTTSNTDLKLIANGTGKVQIYNSSLQLTNNATITGTLNVSSTSSFGNTIVNGLITQTGDYNLTGDYHITGTLSASGNVSLLGIPYLDVGQFKLSGNTISSTVTNGSLTYLGNGTGSVWLNPVIKINDNNIINAWSNATTNIQKSLFFTPNGTGNVVINSNKSIIFPVGDDTSKILSSNGEIRYNDLYNNIEGYESSGYVNFINLYSQDRKTYITGELTPNASDNLLRMSVNNVVTTTVSSTTLFNNTMYAGNISFNNNIISNTNTSNNITLVPSGTGLVKVNTLEILTAPNIVRVPSSGALTFYNTNNGYSKFTGTSGVVLPVGTTSNYPSSPEKGTLRYTTNHGYAEIFNGTIWQPVGGTSSTLTIPEVEDIMWVWDLALG